MCSYLSLPTQDESREIVLPGARGVDECGARKVMPFLDVEEKEAGQDLSTEDEHSLKAKTKHLRRDCYGTKTTAKGTNSAEMTIKRFAGIRIGSNDFSSAKRKADQGCVETRKHANPQKPFVFRPTTPDTPTKKAESTPEIIQLYPKKIKPETDYDSLYSSASLGSKKAASHSSIDVSLKFDKRKRSNSESSVAPRKSFKSSHSVEVVIRPDTSNFPMSQVLGYQSSYPHTEEYDALERIESLWRSDTASEDSPDIEITDFCVYQEVKCKFSKTKSFALVELFHIQASRGRNEFYLDGVLNYKGDKFFVQKLRFSVLSIGGYSLEESSTISWIQTTLARSFGFWYHLKSPSVQYQSYFTVFEWVGDFGKYFIDYVLTHPEAVFGDLQLEFSNWLRWKSPHRRSAELKSWLSRYPSRDYRTAAVRYVDWLWKEVSGIGNDKLKTHSIWGGFRVESLTIRQQSLETPNTTVTPFVHDCFKDLYFGPVLGRRSLSSEVGKLRKDRMKSLQFAKEATPIVKTPRFTIKSLKIDDVRAGQVIATQRDNSTTWNDDAEVWFAYIQRILPSKSRNPYLDVVWLYAPSHTICGNMYYPYQNELFWSDHCNCGEESLRLSDVIGTVDDVIFLPKAIPSNKYFIRQMYDTQVNAFTTLAQTNCSHTRSPCPHFSQRWKAGDFVLIEQKGRLNPVVLNGFENGRVQARLLHRRSDFEPDAKPHELLWDIGSSLLDLTPDSILDKCYVKICYSKDERPPAPYDRDGQGNYFIITGEYDGEVISNLNRNKDYPSSPEYEGKRLRSLGLFAGGGIFDRGLEEGGAIRTTHVVEWNEIAINTYAANAGSAPTSKIGYYLGSVDDHLRAAIEGRTGPEVPAVNTIDHICGGSCCQGFSLLQQDTASAGSTCNASKVATMASYYDLYRPFYGTFENVPAMTRPLGAKKDQNVFSQLVCALVAMGYQLRVFNLDSWSFGSCQSRSRLFISIAAPLLKALNEPSRSHAHPVGTKNRSLGKAANGLPFGERSFGATPFTTPIAAATALQDLPEVSLTSPQCLTHPDHVFGILNPMTREIITSLPQQGFLEGNVNIVRTIASSNAPSHVRKYWSTAGALRRAAQSNSFTRVKGNSILPTVTTSPNLSCAKGGAGIHWQQNRPLTLLEARRAQGYLDHEPLLGNFSNQWKIVGNSVARPVALALGIKLREAWESCSPEVIQQLESCGMFESVEDKQPIRQSERVNDEPVYLLSHESVREVTTTTTTVTTETTRSSAILVKTKAISNHKNYVASSFQPQPVGKDTTTFLIPSANNASSKREAVAIAEVPLPSTIDIATARPRSQIAEIQSGGSSKSLTTNVKSKSTMQARPVHSGISVLQWFREAAEGHASKTRQSTTSHPISESSSLDTKPITSTSVKSSWYSKTTNSSTIGPTHRPTSSYGIKHPQRPSAPSRIRPNDSERTRTVQPSGLSWTDSIVIDD